MYASYDASKVDGITKRALKILSKLKKRKEF